MDIIEVEIRQEPSDEETEQKWFGLLRVAFNTRAESIAWLSSLPTSDASTAKPAEAKPRREAAKPAEAKPEAAKGDWVSPPAQPAAAPAAPNPAVGSTVAAPAAAPQEAPQEGSPTDDDEVPADIIAAHKPRDVLVLLRDKYGVTALADMILWCTEHQSAVPCLAGEADLSKRLQRAAAVAGIR